ncbi:MAG: histidinol-phosphatase [Eubacteriales bacterium]|nr:histidinol-phosphatase [Eubacteriales bacterium]
MHKELERVNYHGHCERCRHARGPARSYAEEAIRKGLVRLGISDHLPFPDDRFGLRMPYSEMEDYLREIRDLKEEMKGILKIFCGFEGEYFKEDRKYYEELLADDRCEYLLLGQHYFPAAQGGLVNAYQIKDPILCEDYSRSVVEAMKTGYFRYVAHPDLIFINDFAWDIHCERACDILIEGALRYHFPLEYNANGFRRKKQMYADGERYPYPYERFWQKVKTAKIDVYVGSDCHEPEQVYDDVVEMAYEKLEEMGIIPETDWL